MVVVSDKWVRSLAYCEQTSNPRFCSTSARMSFVCSRDQCPRHGLDVAGANLHDLEVAAAEIFPLACAWLQMVILPARLKLWVHDVFGHRLCILQLLAVFASLHVCPEEEPTHSDSNWC
jgi:hypothetical protein